LTLRNTNFHLSVSCIPPPNSILGRILSEEPGREIRQIQRLGIAKSMANTKEYEKKMEATSI
jgi:hypothetical protein